MTQHLFVYGTLGLGGPNEHILAAIGGTWSEAWVKGHLEARGWGAAQGYPGIVAMDEAGDEIRGYLFTSDRLATHWQQLDKFEGDGYRRVLATVWLDIDQTVEAYVYLLSHK